MRLDAQRPSGSDERVRVPVELGVVLHEHAESRADAEDVAGVPQQRSSSVGIRECKPDARELEEGVGGQPRDGGRCDRQKLVGALERSGRLVQIAFSRGVSRADRLEQESDERLRGGSAVRDRGRLGGEGLGVGALVLARREQRAEAEAEDRQLMGSGRGGQLDRQHQLALRA